MKDLFIAVPVNSAGCIADDDCTEQIEQKESPRMVALLDHPHRLTSDEPRPGNLRLHRSADERNRGADERIEARRLDHTLLARRQPRLSLTLHCTTEGGLSATSSVPLSSGERLSLFMPSQSIFRRWGTLGHVIRCEPAADGYRIAIAFDALPAA